MEKNQLIKCNGTIYRVLDEEGGSVLLIDCMEMKMPKWHRTDGIAGYGACTEAELSDALGTVLEKEVLKP